VTHSPCRYITRLEAIKKKLDEKSELTKAYKLELKLIKQSQHKTNKSLKTNLNKSADTKMDNQRKLIDNIENEKIKASSIALKIEQVKNTSSKQDDELAFTKKKHEKLISSDAYKTKERELEAQNTQSSEPKIDTSGTSEEIQQRYHQAKADVDGTEKTNSETITKLKSKLAEVNETLESLEKVLP
jgi:hypothetical protein